MSDGPSLDMISMHMEQLAVLSAKGVDVSDLLFGLAKILRGTHVASPEGLKEVEA